MTLVLEIPDALALELGGSGAEVRARVQVELAVHFYATGVVSMGGATEISGLPRHEFEACLAARGVERSYEVEDWLADRAWASESC